MPFPAFTEKLGSSSFLAIAKEGAYGYTAGLDITSVPLANTTATSTSLTDPVGIYVAGALVGRTITTTSGTNSGTSGVITVNTGTVITVASWSAGVPGNGAAYTISGANNYTVNSYLPITGCTIEPDPGLFSPAVMMAQRDKNIFALYGQYKFSGAVDAPTFPTNGMQFLVGSIGPDVNQYGVAPATTCFGYVTTNKAQGSTAAMVVNYAGLAANSVFPATGAFTVSFGALGVGQYGSNSSLYTSSSLTTFTGTTAVDQQASWGINQWAGRVVTSGTSAATIVSNTATTLTTTAWRNGAGAATPSLGATFTIQANFTAQTPSQSFNLLSSQVTVVQGGGQAATITPLSGAGATIGALPYAITAVSFTSGVGTTFTATGVTDSAGTFAVNSLVGKIIVSTITAGPVTVAGVVTANSATQIDVAGGWFVVTSGVAAGGPPTNANTYTLSGNNVVQITRAPYFHSITATNSVLPSYTIEKSLGGAAGGNAQSEQFIGCRIGKYTMKLGAVNTEASFSADVTGRNGVVLDPPSTPSYTDENPFVFSEAYVSLFGANQVQASNIEIDIDNGLKQTWTFDQTHQLSFNTPVVRTIVGKLTVVHDNLTDPNYGYWNKLLVDQTQGSVEMTLIHPPSGGFLPGVTPNEQVQITLPAVNLAKYADDLKLEDVILTNLDYTAFLDLGQTTPHSIRAVVANQQSYAF